MCDVLKELYSNIYSEAFNYEDINGRIKLQKAVYILENMGIPVGDYSFSWSKYGPYSLALDSDAKKCSTEPAQNVTFSKEAETGFDHIKSYLGERKVYDVAQWVECIASIHYMKYILKIKNGMVR